MMDTKKYISSGCLEAYVCGLLSKEEERNVSELIITNEEISAAFEQIKLDFEHYKMLYAVSPPPEIRHRLLRILKEQEEAVPAHTYSAHELNTPVAYKRASVKDCFKQLRSKLISCVPEWIARFKSWLPYWCHPNKSYCSPPHKSR